MNTEPFAKDTDRFVQDTVNKVTHYFLARQGEFGWSLYTLQPFKPGEKICSYPGRLVTDEVAYELHLQQQMESLPITNTVWINKGWRLVPDEASPHVGRLINAADSSKGQVANCRFVVDQRGSKRVTVASTDYIKAGDELFAAYGSGLTRQLNQQTAERRAAALPLGRPSKLPYGMGCKRGNKGLKRCLLKNFHQLTSRLSKAALKAKEKKRKAILRRAQAKYAAHRRQLHKEGAYLE